MKNNGKCYHFSNLHSIKILPFLASMLRNRWLKSIKKLVFFAIYFSKSKKKIAGVSSCFLIDFWGIFFDQIYSFGPLRVSANSLHQSWMAMHLHAWNPKSPVNLSMMTMSALAACLRVESNYFFNYNRHASLPIKSTRRCRSVNPRRVSSASRRIESIPAILREASIPKDDVRFERRYRYGPLSEFRSFSNQWNCSTTVSTPAILRELGAISGH